jgi:RimJ/RimL family protein N-acetyltransferase
MPSFRSSASESDVGNGFVTVTERLRRLSARAYPAVIALLPDTDPDPADASSKLALRRATEAEVGFLSALAAGPEVEPFLAFGAADEERLRSLLTAPGPDPRSGSLLVIQSGAGEVLGGLAVTLVNQRSRICDLSRLMIRPDRRRSGIATTAVALACRYALRDHGMHRVQAECYGDNPAAHRVFERAGFTREGTRRRAYWRRGDWLDGIMFGLLAEELRQGGAVGCQVAPL